MWLGTKSSISRRPRACSRSPQPHQRRIAAHRRMHGIGGDGEARPADVALLEVGQQRLELVPPFGIAAGDLPCPPPPCSRRRGSRASRSPARRCGRARHPAGRPASPGDRARLQARAGGRACSSGRARDRAAGAAADPMRRRCGPGVGAMSGMDVSSQGRKPARGQPVAGHRRGGPGGVRRPAVAAGCAMPAKVATLPPARKASGVTVAKRCISVAMMPVQPVWWLAPSPAPLSPWKYSWKSRQSRQCGSSWNFRVPPKTGRSPAALRRKVPASRR